MTLVYWIAFLSFESWQARVCMSFFSTLMFWSNENKTCLRVVESWQERVCMSWWEFFQLLCPVETTARVAWELASESLYESFSTLVSWSNENKSCIRVTWELTSELCEFFFNFHVAVNFYQLSYSFGQTFLLNKQPLNSFLISFPDVFSKISMTSPFLVRKILICRNSIRHLENFDAETSSIVTAGSILRRTAEKVRHIRLGDIAGVGLTWGG